jgi:hypothetical protein
MLLKMEGIVVWRIQMVVGGGDYGWELSDVGTSNYITNVTQGKYTPVTTRNGIATCNFP